MTWLWSKAAYLPAVTRHNVPDIFTWAFLESNSMIAVLVPDAKNPPRQRRSLTWQADRVFRVAFLDPTLNDFERLRRARLGDLIP